MPNVIEWIAAGGVAALLAVGAARLLRADEPPDPLAPANAFVRALGAPTGVLAVINPVNCALQADDAEALNALAATPGLRVTVLIAVPGHDSLLTSVRRDFGFSPRVALLPASAVDPRTLPEVFRTPFVAVVVRGQLRHAAWGESLKTLAAWLPALINPDHTLSAPYPSSQSVLP